MNNYPMYPNGYQMPNTVGFSINTTNDDKTEHFTIDKLRAGETHHSPAVGLNLDSLIIHENPTTESVEKSSEIVKPSFDSLKKNVPTAQSQKKFSLQTVAEDYNPSMLPKPVTEESHINKQAPLNSTVGKKVNNWFTRLLDQRGQDYISSGKLTVDEVSRNAERIIDDMISGKIDYTKQGSYIITPVIIETLINYCYNKLSINEALQFSLGYVYNDYSNRMAITDPNRLNVLSGINDALSRNISQSIAIVNQDIGIYRILYDKLVYANNTKNASSLFSIANELNNYRKSKLKRY